MKIKELTLPIILAGIIGITFLCQQNRITSLQNDLNKVRIVAGSLPEDVINMSTLDKHILTQIHRHAGTDSVYVTTEYVPLESEVTYITQVDTIAMGELEQAQILLAQLELQMETTADSMVVDSLRIAIQNLQRMVYVTKIEFDTHGWCIEPTVSGGFSTNLTFPYGGGIRLYYIDRWGIGIQGSYDGNGRLGMFCDYRIPKWEGIAPYGAVEYDFEREKFGGSIGIHIYFR